MKRRDFVKGCICCSCLGLLAIGGGAYKFKDNKQMVHLTKEELNEPIMHLEVHIVEQCNLNCKYCSHFSPLAEKEFYKIEEYERDMKRLALVTQGKLNQLQILGGEPLLHPQVSEFIKISRKYLPDTTLNIITNAILLDKMNDDFWKTLRDTNTTILPSLYPIAINWDIIYDKADKYNVRLENESRNYELLKKEDIEKYKIKEFYRMKINEEGSRPANSILCDFRHYCCNFLHGKIYPCFVASNIRHFNKYFKKHIPITKEDYVDIYKINSIEEINAFLKKPEIPFCKYCQIATESSPWENTPNHTIEEWT